MISEGDYCKNMFELPKFTNKNRDELVSAATTGTTTFGGVTYQATSETIAGLLPIGSQGVNHGMFLGDNVP